jgi:hypothetical protein
MTSRRSVLASVLLVALSAGSAPALAFATHATARSVVLPYQGSASVQGVVSGADDMQGGHYGYVTLTPSRKERSVSVRVTDARGLPVAFQLSQGYVRDTRTMHDLGEFCSSTPGAVRLPQRGVPVVVYVELGYCGTSPSVPTTGSVTLTLR